MSKVILTLTTLPTRITQDYETGIKSNINSLINQNYDNYEIHFNVPLILKHTNTTYIIPEWLRELERTNPKFKIFDNLEDIGPFTKSYYTIKRSTDPEDIIIVCDDDLVYHPDMISEHVKKQALHENTAIGYDGTRAEDPSVFDDVRNHFVVSVYKDIEVNILQHYKTVSYKKKFFSDDIDEFVGKSWNDDILLGAYMGKRGIKKIVTFYEHEEPLLTIEQWREKGGVTTFPVISHTAHEGQEGCNLYRADQINENYEEFLKAGYLK